MGAATVTSPQAETTTIWSIITSGTSLQAQASAETSPQVEGRVGEITPPEMSTQPSLETTCKAPKPRAMSDPLVGRKKKMAVECTGRRDSGDIIPDRNWTDTPPPELALATSSASRSLVYPRLSCLHPGMKPCNPGPPTGPPPPGPPPPMRRPPAVTYMQRQPMSYTIRGN